MYHFNLLSWVLLLYLQKDNTNEIVPRNVSLSLNQDFTNLCFEDFKFIQGVFVIDDNGQIMKNWQVKLYFTNDDDEEYVQDSIHQLKPPYQRSVTIRSGVKRRKMLYLRFCGANQKLLIYKMEAVRFLDSTSRSRRSLKNDLHQTWSADMFQQKFTDEKGLEITVKLPRGNNTTTANSKRRTDKNKTKMVSTTEESIAITTSTTSTTSPTDNITTSTILPNVPLTPVCESYKTMLNSVLKWTHARLDDLKTGKISDIECSLSIPPANKTSSTL